ncbi:hypothetical protein PybrP1_008152 [[Pythium] brassicae (nom. inval.)]|nr:hypothetical protein PybrP1_008152 [[Pythium] brassicae (nom. inval.)]
MDATRVYPNWPPVVATTGLAGAVAAVSPDAVPLAPRLVNGADSTRERLTLHARGVLRPFVRNRAALATLRPHKRMRLASAATFDRGVRTHTRSEAVHLRRRCRDFVPAELLLGLVEENFRPDKEPTDIPKWQGNAIAGARTAAGDHIVFYPGGEVLQQACALVRVFGSEPRCFVSTGVETGATIRQFAVMGGAFAQSTGELFVAARGAANCTVLQAPSLRASPTVRMKAKLKLTFADMLYHVAASPHVEAELAFVTGDGLVHWWEPESGVQTLNLETAMVSERLLRCEYSRSVVQDDARVAKAKPLTHYDKVFDLASVGSPLAEIYDVKRRSSCPFQFVVGSAVSIDLMDSRMGTQPLLSWAQQVAVGDAQTEFGAIEEVDLSANPDECRGAILSTSLRRKVTTVYPFERSSRAAKRTLVPLSSLRNVDDDAESKSSHISQFVVSDAPLDLSLVDGGEWTSLLGVCALPLPRALEPKRGATAATVYLMNDLGDRKQLPLRVDAILPEHDSASLTPFVPLALKLWRHKFPRLPRERQRQDGEPEPTIDAERLVTALLAACRPSATLFRLHRFVNDALAFPIASRDLTLFLRSRREFHVRSVHRAFRPQVARVLLPDGVEERPIHERDGDPRLAVCACSPATAEAPCESLSCVVPHALVVSSVEGLRLHEIFPQQATPSSSAYAAIVAEAREMYGADAA